MLKVEFSLYVYTYVCPSAFSLTQFVECATNEYECYGVEDELGCVGPSTCVPEDAECPTSQFSGGCPVYDPKDYECDWETEIACPGGMDPKVRTAPHD